MPTINLIPRPLLDRRRRQRRLRRWALVVAVSWSVCLLPVGCELVAFYRLSEQRAIMNETSRTLEDAKSKYESGVTELKALRHEIARARELRHKRNWTSLLSVVSNQLPEGVWLSVLATDPQRPLAGPVGVVGMMPARKASAHEPTAESQHPYMELAGKSGPFKLYLEGSALSLEEIYVLIGNLKETAAFRDVALKSVKSGQVQQTNVTNFALECDW